MSLVVRPLREADLPTANAIYRDSFTSFLKLPPDSLDGQDILTPRVVSGQYVGFAAEFEGELVGAVLTVSRGSMAVLGPVIVRPRGWTGNAGLVLTEAALAVSAKLGATMMYGMTHSNSPQHLDYFRRFNVRPRFLSATLSATVPRNGAGAEPACFSSLDVAGQEACLAQAAALTSDISPGLDWNGEVRAVHQHGLGETLLLWDGERLEGFAICHLGPRSEAMPSRCYVKFGAVRSGAGAEQRFSRLMEACTAHARARGVQRLDTGISLERVGAYELLRARGFVISHLGVSMVRPNVDAHMRPDVFLLDDGR